MWYQFNLLRLQAHSIWMGRSFCSLDEIPASTNFNPLTNKICSSVFRFTKKNDGFYLQEARGVSFQHNLKTFLKSSSSTWSAWNQIIAVISHKHSLSHKLFWVDKSLSCHHLPLMQISESSDYCDLHAWVRNVRIVPLCSIGYSTIHLFGLFVICLQSSPSLSYSFPGAEASREIQTFGGKILFLSEISIIACISRFLRYKTVQHSEIVYYQ